LDYKKCPYQSVIDHSESNSGATKNSIATTAIVS